MRQALEGLSSVDSTIGYWAETPICGDSEVRVGQIQLENGGVLDDKIFIGTLEQLYDAMYCLISDESTLAEDKDIDLEYKWQVAADMVIDDLSIDWKIGIRTGCMHCGDPQYHWVDADTRACSKHCTKVLTEVANQEDDIEFNVS